MKVIKEIGTPAMLEQCAEECSELAHACLKMARWIRDENPTPADIDTMNANLIEEMADVYLCIQEITAGKGCFKEIIDIRNEKLERWEKRIEAHKKGEKYD